LVAIVQIYNHTDLIIINKSANAVPQSVIQLLCS